MSGFCSDTKGTVEDTFFFFFRLTCSVTLWGGADSQLGLRFVPFPDIAAQMMRCLARAIAATYRLPPLGYLGVKPAHLLRQMLTVQTPKKF